MTADTILLRRYAAERAEPAFAEFVDRHLPLVYSAALRRLGGDAHRARDVAQAVFTAAARESARLANHPNLTGWLYTTTRYAATDVLRSEHRRRRRERTAHEFLTLDAADPAVDWSRLSPVLDEALDDLRATDRDAVLLRYFDGQPFAQIGAGLGLTEEAARKRVERALDKLRASLRRRGIVSTATALGTLLAAESVAAAPTGVATAIAAQAATAAIATAAPALFTISTLSAGIAAAIVVGGVVTFVARPRTVPEPSGTPAARLTDSLAKPAATTPVNPPPPPPAPSPSPSAVARTATPSSVASTTKSAAAASSERERLHRRYDPFLFRYGLSPAQADRFIDLKIAIAEAQAELQAAVRQAGAAGGTAGVESLRQQLVGEQWAEIRRLLGEEAFAAYRGYERLSALQSAYLDPLAPALSAAGAPLRADQTDALLALMDHHHQSVRLRPTDISTTGFIDWQPVLVSAAAFLSPPQLAVLQRAAARQTPASQPR